MLLANERGMTDCLSLRCDDGIATGWLSKAILDPLMLRLVPSMVILSTNRSSQALRESKIWKEVISCERMVDSLKAHMGLESESSSTCNSVS